MKKYTHEELTEILAKHKKWLNDEEGGECADLRFIHSADGNVLACMNAGKYQVVLSKDKIAIGCKFYEVDAWRNFDDDKISRMDNGALEWWKQWKDLVFMFHKNIFG